MINVFLLTIFASVFVLFLAFLLANTTIKKIKAKGQIKSFISTLESVTCAYLYKSYGYIILISACIIVGSFFFISHELSIGFFIGTVISIVCSHISSMFFCKVVGRLQNEDALIEKRFDLAFTSSAIFGIGLFAFVLFIISVSHFIFPESMDVVLGVVTGYSLSLFLIKKGAGVLQRASQENIDNTVDISKKAVSTVSLLVSKSVNFGGIALDNTQSFLLYATGVFLMTSFLFDSFVDVYSLFLIACISSLVSAMIIAVVVRSFDLVSSVGSFYVTIIGSIATNALLFLGSSYWLFDDIEIDNKIILYFCLVAGMFFSGLVIFYYYYYTAKNFSPTKNIFRFSLKDGASAFISSFGIGMESVVIPSLSAVSMLLVGYFIGDIYGIIAILIGFFMIMPVILIFNFFSLLAPSVADFDEESEHNIIKFLESAQSVSSYASKGYSIFVGYIASIIMMFVLGHYVLFQNNTKDTFLVDPIYFLSGILIGFCCIFLFISVVFRSIVRISNNISDRINSYKININSNNTEQFIWITNLMGSSIRRDSLYSVSLLFVFTPIIAFTLREQALLGFVSGVVVCGFLLSFFFLIMGFMWGNADNIVKEDRSDFSNREVDKKTLSDIAKATIVLRDSLSEFSGIFVKTILSISFLLIPII